MPLKDIPYKRIRSLISIYLTNEESAVTRRFVKKLNDARKRGYLRKSELMEICRWKSPRAIRLVEGNTPGVIRRRSYSAFCSKNEIEKMNQLISLKGVSIPMASAILTLTDPNRYGVLDIRVWQLLYKMKVVGQNPGGTGFNLNHWIRFLEILRSFAADYNVRARDIERALYDIHVEYQEGRLYR